MNYGYDDTKINIDSPKITMICSQDFFQAVQHFHEESQVKLNREQIETFYIQILKTLKREN